MRFAPSARSVPRLPKINRFNDRSPAVSVELEPQKGIAAILENILAGKEDATLIPRSPALSLAGFWKFAMS